MDNRKQILILLDSNGHLTEKIVGTSETHYPDWISVSEIVDRLQSKYYVKCCKYSELDLTVCYKDYYVIYASSENRGLTDKDYMEDVLLRLHKDGARLIPDFYSFRAHHNKSFQEILRKGINNPSINKLQSYCFSKPDEVDYDSLTDFPYVIKASAGAGGNSVMIAHNKSELKRVIQKISRVRYYDSFYNLKYDLYQNHVACKIKTFIKRYLKGDKWYRNVPSYSYGKFIVQKYISGLEGDFKVLYFAGKYYVLKRKNRDNDFRASGSGKFEFPVNISDIKSVLDFSKEVVEEFSAPMISMDIAYTSKECYLIEYQFVLFGPYTMQYSNCYFESCNNEYGWKKAECFSNLEEEFSRSIEYAIEVLYKEA